MARDRRAHGPADAGPRQSRAADERDDGGRERPHRRGGSVAARVSAPPCAAAARAASLPGRLPAAGRSVPPCVQPVPCAARSAAPHRRGMARGRRAHAGEHGVDEPRGRHASRAGRAAAAGGTDQRLSREARAPVRLRPVALRTRLLYLATAAFVPVALMSGVSLFALLHQQRQQSERTGIELARALATAVDAELQRSISVLQGLASATTLDRQEMERFYELTRRVVQGNPSWLTVILADPQGRQITNARFRYGDALPPIVDPESFARVMRTGEPAIGNLARGPGTQLAVPVRVPVIRGGELRYVLTAAVKPDDFVDIVNRQRVPGDWVVSVFDANRMRVARSRQHREYLGSGPAPSLEALMRQRGDEGAGITQVLEGESVYTTYSRSHETNWTVAIGIPRPAAEVAALRSLIVYGGGLLISIALAILAALIVGRGIARPMAELGAAARALGRRERLELPHTPIGEIRQVADSLAVAADERARGEAEREQLLEREQQARAIAEAANRSKDEFLAMLGHELRNPLGALANAAQLLGAMDEETREHARSVIGRQVQHLARMTDDLLDAARAMTGKIVLQRQPLDLAEATARVLSTLRASGRTGRRRIVQALAPAWVDADPTRIEQIVGNLLGNALKFTPEGGTITVSVAREGDETLLHVADTGIGMTRELAARVFEPFVQGARPLDRSQGGLGIGLTLVGALRSCTAAPRPRRAKAKNAAASSPCGCPRSRRRPQRAGERSRRAPCRRATSSWSRTTTMR